MNNVRTFTEADDAQIMRCARGEISMNRLEITLCSSRPTLEKRAAQLGVELGHRRYRKTVVQNGRLVRAGWGDSYECTVRDDKLLAALHLHHPEKYERSET